MEQNLCCPEVHTWDLMKGAREAREPPCVPCLSCCWPRQRILPQCLQAPPAQKLPALYLLDSVSKTVGEPYTSLFVPMLAEVGRAGSLGGRSEARLSTSMVARLECPFLPPWPALLAVHSLKISYRRPPSLPPSEHTLPTLPDP